MEKKVIGILGGMGPLATADLYTKIVRHTAAARDQDHLHVIIDSNTNIPDRTAALLSGGADPTAEMVKSARTLAKAGCECIIMPCNTAHNFHAAVQESVNIPVLHMIELTCAALREKGVTCAGLLATDGTVQTGIYQRVCDKFGIELLLPDEAGQKAVMDMIYAGVKAGLTAYDTAAVEKAAADMQSRGAELMILGCTELPLAAELYGLTFGAIDPTLELAKGAIRFAGGEIK